MASNEASTVLLRGLEVGSARLEVQVQKPDADQGDYHSGGDGPPIHWPSIDVTARSCQGGPTVAVDLPFPRDDRHPVGALDVSATVDPSIADDLDCASIVSRCRLKAAGLRWAVERRRLKAEGGDYRSEIAPKDRDLIERANGVPGCHLWMNRPEVPAPHAPALFEEVAGWFETLASAASCVHEILEEPGDDRGLFVQALGILAESQSALRVAIGWIGGPDDSDQLDVFAWLRSVAFRHRIYLRHLGSHAVDPSPSRAEVSSRLDALALAFRDARKKSHQRRSRYNRVRYHARLIAEGTGGEHDWRRVAEAVDEMVGDGTPPSSPEFRDLLLPILGRLPEIDGLQTGFRLALREIDRFLAGRPSTRTTIPEGRRTAEVAEVARLLRGRGVVLIGGKRRPEAQAALHRAFRLKRFVWVETREHQSIDGFESIVARREFALVLLAVRWSSHSFGDVKRFCEAYGKPLVRLPGGYNPNQVAAQILSQCSEQLAPDRLGLAIPDTLCRVA